MKEEFFIYEPDSKQIVLSDLQKVWPGPEHGSHGIYSTSVYTARIFASNELFRKTKNPGPKPGVHVPISIG
jgi:hypothetical protein